MEHPIVFYDGECGLCAYWVQWILDRDPARIFRFAALQSHFAAELFLAYNQEITMQSLVVLTSEEKFLTRSSAVAYLLDRLKPESFSRRVLRNTPKPVADAGYSVVAFARKLLRRNQCRLFSKEERRFILNDNVFSPDSFPREHKKL